MGEASRHSGEMEDLISAPPSWMLKWGVTVFLVVLILLGGLSVYIRYPDVVPGQLVVRSSGTRFMGELSISQKEIIHIREGQTVIIKLHRYPYENFGVLQGTVETIGDTPDSRGNFIVSVVFKTPVPQGITLKERLAADAQVILRDRSLMDRLLSNIHESVTAK